MTKQEIERDDTQEIERAVYLDKVTELEKAWKELDNERSIVGRLDKQVAALTDKVASVEQQRDSLLQQFQELYNKHESMLEQCLNTATAITITNGKLSEAIVKHKFSLPQANTTTN
jgi:uncharacterized coiled-coil DUF342 family protein